MRRRTTLKRSAAALGLAAMALAMAPSGTPADAAVGEAPVSRPLYTTEAPIVMLKDLDSGAILFERGADKRFAPASMAKVMTAYVVLDLIASGQLPRDKLFTVSEAAWKKRNGSNGGSNMFPRRGEKMSDDGLRNGL